MFTGLIEAVGTVAQVEHQEGGTRLTVSAPQAFLADAKLGDSIAVDGCCTTVVELSPVSFVIEASPETLSKTTMGGYQAGTPVNLERPLTPTARLGGHFVTGHVDGTATVLERTQDGISWIFRFELANPEWAALMIPKGSVTVSGISLTVNEVKESSFTVAIIPHTMEHTNLSKAQVGDRVNIEADLLGKYVQRLLSHTLGQAKESDASGVHRTELAALADMLSSL